MEFVVGFSQCSLCSMWLRFLASLRNDVWLRFLASLRNDDSEFLVFQFQIPSSEFQIFSVFYVVNLFGDFGVPGGNWF